MDLGFHTLGGKSSEIHVLIRAIQLVNQAYLLCYYIGVSAKREIQGTFFLPVYLPEMRGFRAKVRVAKKLVVDIHKLKVQFF